MILNHFCTINPTYIWIADMILPNKPIMPRNSTLLKFLTTNSCATLDTPYITAPHSTRTSPIAWFSPVEQKKVANFKF